MSIAITKSVRDNLDDNPDSEWRVFYVGATSEGHGVLCIIYSFSYVYARCIQQRNRPCNLTF